MSEKSIVKRIMDAAKQRGWMAIKIHGGPFQMSGLPDILCLRHGRAAWIEAKRPGNSPTRIQEHRMRELVQFGCPVTVACSVGDAVEFLESFS